MSESAKETAPQRKKVLIAGTSTVALASSCFQNGGVVMVRDADERDRKKESGEHRADSKVTSATPVVQPEAQVMESVRKLPGVTDDGTWIQCPTSEVAKLVTRECDAARLAAVNEVFSTLDTMEEGCFDNGTKESVAHGKHITRVIESLKQFEWIRELQKRALAAGKEQPK